MNQSNFYILFLLIKYDFKKKASFTAFILLFISSDLLNASNFFSYSIKINEGATHNFCLFLDWFPIHLNGGTLKLKRSMKISSPIYLDYENNTIDLNGYDLLIDGIIYGNNNSLNIKSSVPGGNLNLKGSLQSLENLTIDPWATMISHHAIGLNPTSNLTIEGVFDICGINQSIPNLGGNGVITSSQRGASLIIDMSTSNTFSGIIDDSIMDLTIKGDKSSKLVLNGANILSRMIVISEGAHLESSFHNQKAVILKPGAMLDLMGDSKIKNLSNAGTLRLNNFSLTLNSDSNIIGEIINNFGAGEIYIAGGYAYSSENYKNFMRSINGGKIIFSRNMEMGSDDDKDA